jgi:hypothetical protein
MDCAGSAGIWTDFFHKLFNDRRPQASVWTTGPDRGPQSWLVINRIGDVAQPSPQAAAIPGVITR